MIPAGPPPPTAVAGREVAAERLTPRAAGKAGENTAADNHPRHNARSNGELTAEEQAKVQELRARDREVRAHELAHLAAAGRHARGGASFSYERGPDGRRYAVGGEVNIDTSEVAGDPSATIAKAAQIRRAALAPAEPSAQDRKIATQASAMAAKARSELAQQQRDANIAGATNQNAYSGTNEITPMIDLLA
ncbi:MAG: hypothetical protein KJP03_02500 [Gammaproteobacteria bacterium]|nr:hypothetical protein [Gammaproteobacteria bacterium]